MSETQDSQLNQLADIVSELMKRMDEQEVRNKTVQTQNNLEVAAMKRRMEDLQQHAIKDAKTLREEMDHVVDSLGNLTEDVARRVTKAVQHYEERFTADLEKLREHLDKSINTQSSVLSQKIEAALSASDRHGHEEREGESEDGANTASTAKVGSMRNDSAMRRLESVAHMLRAEALAQAQAFEAKLASVEAGHAADAKRLQGMLHSSYAQLQGLQRSISAMECGVPSANQLNQSPRGKIPQVMPQKPNRAEPKVDSEPNFREELTNKLRSIQTSVTGVLTILDPTPNPRGQSPKRPSKSPVQLPLNPAGTLETQIRQKDFEQGRNSPLLSSSLKEDSQRTATGPSPAVDPREARSVQMPVRAAHRPGMISPGQEAYGAPKTRVSHGMAASMSQQNIPPMMSGRVMPGVYTVHRSGAGSPQMPHPMAMAPQAIPIGYGVRR
ncbi:Uncharacterized protein SCF082_LOCUS35157 [Durusdinium trenchii]|uniref:Uncharacterized protein n=1 Tax=Durusdinium trenchii TaxID=1381693 RepID=A0ABP0P5F1_9DINO